MLKNNKTVEDTHATRDIVEAAVGQVQTKKLCLKTPGRYALKTIMSGFY